MRIFAIRDEERSASETLGYLLYYENAKAFYIELPEDADVWDAPLLLSSFIKRGQHTVNAYWSMVWVRQRIMPPDRQNLGQVLKANGLVDYDEFALLMLAKGRCAQDGYYLTEIKTSEVPDDIKARWSKKLEDVIPISDAQLLAFFRDGSVKKCDVRALVGNDTAFLAVLTNEMLFRAVNLQPDGYGVAWGERLTLSDTTLYDNGLDVPLTLDDFRAFVSYRVVNSAEAQDMLQCSRQYVNELVKKQMLHPIREDAKNKLYLKSEITQRLQN